MKTKLFFSTTAVLVIISIIFGTIFATAQQVMRQSANDPQVQLAQDTAAGLNKGKMPSVINNEIDVSKSLAPFVMVFNKSYQLTNLYAGLVADTALVPPNGVFAYAAQHGQDRFTWQPRSNLRFAAVVVPYNDGFVLSARSLAEVEQREQQLMFICLLGWLLAVGAAVGAAGALSALGSKK